MTRPTYEEVHTSRKHELSDLLQVLEGKGVKPGQLALAGVPSKLPTALRKCIAKRHNLDSGSQARQRFRYHSLLEGNKRLEKIGDELVPHGARVEVRAHSPSFSQSGVFEVREFFEQLRAAIQAEFLATPDFTEGNGLEAQLWCKIQDLSELKSREALELDREWANRRHVVAR